jgi:hypothetical protein
MSKVKCLDKLAQRALAATERFCTNRRQFDRPTVHRWAIKLDASLSRHLFQVSHSQPIGDMPAHARQHHVKRILKSFKHTCQGRRQNLLHRA